MGIKRNKHTVLYPLRPDQDDDDIQDYPDPSSVKKKPKELPAHVAARQGHVPPGQEAERDGKGEKADGEQAGQKNDLQESLDPKKRRELDMYLQQFKPKPFDLLLDDISQFEPTKNPTEFKIFPGDRLKCADYLYVVQGKRRTGKTTLWRTVIPRIASMFPYVYIFAQTRFNNAFGDYVPEQAVFKGYNDGVINAILDMQETKIKTNQRLFERYSEHEDEGALELIPNPFIHCLFDDTVADIQVHNSERLSELAYYGRHFKVSVWINTQHGHALSPGFRANADIAVTFQQACKRLFVVSLTPRVHP